MDAAKYSNDQELCDESIDSCSENMQQQMQASISLPTDQNHDAFNHGHQLKASVSDSDNSSAKEALVPKRSELPVTQIEFDHKETEKVELKEINSSQSKGDEPEVLGSGSSQNEILNETSASTNSAVVQPPSVTSLPVGTLGDMGHEASDVDGNANEEHAENDIHFKCNLNRRVVDHDVKPEGNE